MLTYGAQEVDLLENVLTVYLLITYCLLTHRALEVDLLDNVLGAAQRVPSLEGRPREGDLRPQWGPGLRVVVEARVTGSRGQDWAPGPGPGPGQEGRSQGQGQGQAQGGQGQGPGPMAWASSILLRHLRVVGIVPLLILLLLLLQLLITMYSPPGSRG